MTEVTQHNELYPTGLPMNAGGVAVLSQFPHIEQDTYDQNRDIRNVDDLRPDIGRDPDNAAVIAEEDVVVGALERVRFFVQEKQEQLAEKIQTASLTKHTKKLGAIAATSVALLGIQATPAGEKIAEKAPVVKEVLTTPDAKAEVAVNYEIGKRYPWANAPIGSVDKYQNSVRVCSSYTTWRLEQNGVNTERLTRAITDNLYNEVIDNTPAVGAMAKVPGHEMYVENVEEIINPDGTVDYAITFSDYNSINKYGYALYTYYTNDPNPKMREYLASFKYYHFEIPNPRFDNKNDTTNPNIYLGAKYDRRSRNAITSRKAIKSGTFIRSANKQFNLTVDSGLLRLDDTKKDQDTTNDETVWQVRAPKKATQLKVELGKGKQRGKNRLIFTDDSGKRKYKSWYIGKANRLMLNNRGEIVGLKGKKPIAKTDKSIAHIALASRRAERKQAQIMRAKKQR